MLVVGSGKHFHLNPCTVLSFGQPKLNKLLDGLQALILPCACYLSIKKGAVPLWEVTNTSQNPNPEIAWTLNYP
jgi:hypothetical protein